MKKIVVGAVCAAAVLVLVLAAVPAFREGRDTSVLVRSTQTKDSEKSQRAMEALAEPEALETRADEYGLVEMTASVRIPDYSQYFSQCWEEAAKEAKDEADFEKRLFALTEERTREGDVQWTTREVSVNLSLADEEKKAWKDEELEELARREAFEQEMREFALELVGGVIGQSTDWEALGQAGEEAR